MVKYRQLQDGELERPVMRGYRIRCCECGLVHVVDFFVVHEGKRHHIEFRASRGKRATAAARRGGKFKKGTTK